MQSMQVGIPKEPLTSEQLRQHAIALAPTLSKVTGIKPGPAPF